MANKEVVIGIDFGTSNSSLSISFPNKEIKTIELDGEKDRLLRSIVKYSDSEITVGRDANDIKAVCDGNVVFNAKRLIGRKYRDLGNSDMKNKSGAKVVEDEDGYAAYYIPILGRKVTPIDVVSEIIKKIFDKAMTETKEYTISSVVVTYPASYKQDQIAATQTAVKKVIKDIPILFITEPVSASYTFYNVNGSNVEYEGNILVYDLGGGTFDLSLIQIKNQKFRILKTNGCDNIGGEHFDDLIMKYVIKEYEKDAQPNDDKRLMPDKEEDKELYERLLSYLRESCKKAKEDLCKTDTSQHISIESFMEKFREYSKKDEDDDAAIEYPQDDVILTRELFEGMIKKDIAKTLEIVNDTLNKEGLKYEDIDKVVLIGGSTKIPYVRLELTRVFKKKGILCDTIDPSICVSYGAAAYGRERDVIEVKSTEGIKYDYYTLIRCAPSAIQNSVKCRSLMIPKGSMFDEPVERIYNIPKGNEGCWCDTIYEGDIHDENQEVELATIDGYVQDVSDKKVQIKYIFTLSNDGLLHYEVKNVESGTTIIDESVLSTRSQYSRR